MSNDLHVVTGAYGYSGRYIARRLLNAGQKVATLTNSPERSNPFGDAVPASPLAFDVPKRLAESLRGARVLYNTYWVRFNAADFTHKTAVENTLRLFEAAQAAGVERLIHTSIANPSEDSELEYYSGKARLERALRDSGLSYAILRPTVLFGREDILVNNIAWMIRHMPVFGVFGDGQYKLQPIFVDDFAELAVRAGESVENSVTDAIGPETFTYKGLVEQIAAIIGQRRKVVSVAPSVGYAVGRVVGWFVQDVTITREEIAGLMQGLLCTQSPPAGTTKLTEWAREHANELGVRYASEMARRRDRRASYA